MSQPYLVAAVAAILGLFLLVVVAAGAPGGGAPGDPSFYCRVSIEGKVIGNNLALGEGLNCQSYPFPGDTLRLIGGDSNIKCQAKVDDNRFGEEKKIGDLGFTQEAFYNFKISRISDGKHKVTVQCQGDSASVQQTYPLEVNN